MFFCLFVSFQQLTARKVLKNCRWLDLKLNPLVSEATTLCHKLLPKLPSMMNGSGSSSSFHRQYQALTATDYKSTTT